MTRIRQTAPARYRPDVRTRGIYGRGGISQSELKALAEDMKKTAAGMIDTCDDAFKKFDANGDGSLGADQLKSVMDAGRSGSTQGPPLPDQWASSSSNSLQDQISLLRDLLEKLSKTGSSGSSTSSVVSVTT